MILSKSQSKRFMSLMDELTLYANAALEVVDVSELYAGSSFPAISTKAQSKVMQRVWADSWVVGSYIEDNLARLDAREAASVELWDEALTGYFTAQWLPTGQLALVDGGYAFVVHGITREIETMLSTVPCMISTMLLPFDGVITYTISIEQMNVIFGDAMRASLQEELDEIVAEGRVVSTAEGFLEAVRAMRAEEEKSMFDDVVDEAEIVLAATEPIKGHHRGPLAGISGEEREEMIRAHYGSFADDDFALDDPVAMMRQVCRFGTPKFTCAELLYLMKKVELEELVEDLDLAVPIQLKKADLANALVDELAKPEVVATLAKPIPEAFLDVFAGIVKAGGRLFLPEEEVNDITQVCPPYEPLFYLFHSKEGFTYVIPDELLDAARQLDFEKLHREAKLKADVRTLAAAAADLRGIVPLYEFIQECRGRHPELETDEEAVSYAMSAAASMPLFGMLVTEDDSYLLDGDLAAAYLDENDGDVDTIPDTLVILGELDDLLDSILEDQGDRPYRPVDDKILEYPLAAIWREQLPAAEKLRNWFDENIPDGADDFLFAERMVSDFASRAKWGFGGAEALRSYLDILERSGFGMDEAHLQPFLNLLMDFVNTQPTWPNNGWAANDFDEHGPLIIDKTPIDLI